METSVGNAVIAAALLLIAVVIMVVNLLTIAVVLRTPQLRYSDQWQTNKYVLSLAVADTLVGVSLLWVSSLYLSETRAFMDSSYVLCLSTLIFASLSMAVSDMTLLVVAVDRLLYIVYPYLYRRLVSERLTTTIIFIIWGLCLLASCIVYLLHNNFNYAGCKPVTVFLTDEVKFIVSYAVLSQSLIAGACYLRIACAVRSQKQRIHESSQVVGTRRNEDKSPCTPFPREATDKHKTSSQLTTPSCAANPSQAATLHRDTEFGAGASLETCSQPTPAPAAASTLGTSDVDVGLGNTTERKQETVAHAPTSQPKSPTAATVSVRMFVAVNTLFSFTWFPFILYSFCFDKGSDSDDTIGSLVFFAVGINSAINFVVYGWKNVEYRKAYKKIFTDFYELMCKKFSFGVR